MRFSHPAEHLLPPCCHDPVTGDEAGSDGRGETRRRLGSGSPFPTLCQLASGSRRLKKKEVSKQVQLKNFFFSPILQTSLDIEHYFNQNNKSNHNCPYGLDRKTSLRTICKLTSRTVL
jgi:hypothetical protein